jgi:BASS family bile acid:Na+ symporter
MHEDLLHVLKIAASIAIPLASLATGLRAATVDPLWLLKRPSLLVRSLLAILVLVPIGTIAFLHAIGASPLVASGVIVAILAVGLGPAAELKRTRAAEAHVVYEVELNVVLLALSIVFIPLAVALVGKHFHRDLHLDASAVAALVLTRALVPLLLGVAVARLLPRLAAPLGRLAAPAIQIFMLAVVAVALVGFWRPLFALGARAWAICGVVALGALAIGHLCGGPEREDRRVLATLSSVRFPGMALLVASVAPLGKKVVPVVLAYIISSALITAVYGTVTSRRPRPAGRAVPAEPVLPAPGRA